MRPTRLAVAGQPQHLPLAVAQRIGLVPRLGGQLRRNRPPPGLHCAHRSRQLPGGRVLQQVTANPDVQCTPQVAGTGESGQDDHAHVALDQFCRQLQTGNPRHLDVGEHDVRLQTLGQLQRLGTVPRPTDHLDVLFEVEQRGQCAQHHCLILGDQDADQAAASSDAGSRDVGRSGTVGIRTVRATPRAVSIVISPLACSTRSRIPAKPAPSWIAPPRPSSDRQAYPTVLASQSRPALTGGCMANDVGDRFSQAHRQYRFLLRGSVEHVSVDGEADATGLAREPGVGQLGIQICPPEPGHGLAYLAQRTARDTLHLADLLPGAAVPPRCKFRGELGLDGDQRQCVTEQVVEVACDPFALGDGRKPAHLGLRDLQGGFLTVELVRVDARGADQRRERATEQQDDVRKVENQPLDGDQQHDARELG